MIPNLLLKNHKLEKPMPINGSPAFYFRFISKSKINAAYCNFIHCMVYPPPL